MSVPWGSASASRFILEEGSSSGHSWGERWRSASLRSESFTVLMLSLKTEGPGKEEKGND